MASDTIAVTRRFDKNLLIEFDSTADAIGISPTSAMTVFMKQFVAHRGFPFEVKVPVPTKDEYIREMDEIFAEMRAGKAEAHELIEVWP